MKKFIWLAVLALLPVPAMISQPPQDAGKQPAWAFPVADATQPPAEPETEPKKVPGSTKSYTQAQIDDLFNPPDWFPDEHPPMPKVVKSGNPPKVMACGSCHLMSGMGHPESSQLAGFSASYIAQQLADFKSGDRKDPARMTAIGMALTDEEAMQASEYFAMLKPIPWEKVVETDTVPKTYVNKARQRIALPGGAMEPIGNRIIEVPQDTARVVARDPHAGFIAYVPKGSLAKGEALVKTGAGKTIQCSVCHGDTLQGAGDVPRIAGLSPVYSARQIYNFKNGSHNGGLAELMKAPVEQLTDDDILNIAAYLASQQ